jgi:hypothetical protein
MTSSLYSGSTSGNVITARAGASAQVWNGNMVVFGGTVLNASAGNRAVMLNDVIIFDPVQQSWSSMPVTSASANNTGVQVAAENMRRSWGQARQVQHCFIGAGSNMPGPGIYVGRHTQEKRSAQH